MRLSSSTTFLWKYLFPGVWVFGFASGIVAIVRAGSIEMPGVWFFILMALGFGFSFWILGSLKSVYLEGGSLRVSNLFQTIVVPLSEVEMVDGPDGTSHRRITVSLKSPTLFGLTIVFMPSLLSARPTADRLRRAIDATTNK